MTSALKHSDAIDDVLDAVRGFKCQICNAKTVLKTIRSVAVPLTVGLLRKELPDWVQDQGITAPNVLC
eukprot:11892354-Heterocapsa_arctica.AAC.1